MSIDLIPEEQSPPSQDEPMDYLRKVNDYVGEFALRKLQTGPTTSYEFKQQIDLETDDLTGLGNDLMLKRILTEIVEEEDCKKTSSLGLLMFDLDRFKSINDTLGHSFGDEVLAFIGKKLPKILRNTDISTHRQSDEVEENDTSNESEAIRKHGDEFFVVAPDLDDTRNGGSYMTRKGRLFSMAKRLESELAQEVMESELGNTLRDNNLEFGLSVGAAVYKPGQGVEDFLRVVDKNMYEAKKAK